MMQNNEIAKKLLQIANNLDYIRSLLDHKKLVSRGCTDELSKDVRFLRELGGQYDRTLKNTNDKIIALLEIEKAELNRLGHNFGFDSPYQEATIKVKIDNIDAEIARRKIDNKKE